MSATGWLGGVVDAMLEASVVGSFTRVGVRVRRRVLPWEALPPDCLRGKVVVLTGGTSGLGESAVESLARLGAHVTMVARNPSKADAACERLRALTANPAIDYVVADTGDLRAVRRVADELGARHPRGVDVLIHNAGSLDDRYAASADGIEQTLASHVVGPYLLTTRLLPALRAAAKRGPARVLWVSSGGMYSEPLRVDDLAMGDADYDGVTAYARAKRAQVTLAEMLALRYAPDDIRVHCMHPGWADTPGVARSLPRFRRIMGPLLRTAAEGADTLVWLAASEDAPLAESGRFWLDRVPRSIHRSGASGRSDTPAERERLVAWLDRVTA